MDKQNKLWTRDELIVALNLYWKIPYNKISGTSNQKIKDLANIIGRTPASIAYKLMNFTTLDPERQNIGNKGKEGIGKADIQIWNEFFNNWEELAYQSSLILAKIENKPLDEFVGIEKEEKLLEGKEKERLVKARLNQNYFRQRILAGYNEKCSITGLNISSLLVASHIIPWAKNEKERLNPKNGLCLNSIHDKAFDKGLITITLDYKVKLSKSILDNKEDFVKDVFHKYHNQKIMLPDRYLPAKEFIEWHNENIFEKLR